MTASPRAARLGHLALLFVLLLGTAFLAWERTLEVPYLLDDLTGVELLHVDGAFSWERVASVLWPDRWVPGSDTGGFG